MAHTVTNSIFAAQFCVAHPCYVIDAHMTVETDNPISESGSNASTFIERNFAIQEETCSLHPGQLHHYQTKIQYKQIQTELLVSMILVGSVFIVLWGQAPQLILLSWATSIIALIGIRSLFIYRSRDENKPEEMIAWGDFYATFVALSGVCWSTLGIISALYGGGSTSQFSMLVLACISLTAYISMQSSPAMVAALVLPALVPNGLWFIIQDDTMTRVLGIVALVTFWLMMKSTRDTHEVLIKSLSLSSYNTELLHKLVDAREFAEKTTKSAEEFNFLLKEEIKGRQCAEGELKASKQKLGAILNNMREIIYQIDMDGKIQWTTPSVRDILGYDSKEIKHKNIKDYYHDQHEFLRLKKELHASDGIVNNFITRMVHKNDASIWISNNCHYKYDGNREVIGVEGVLREITTLRQAQEALFIEKENTQVTLTSIVDGVIRTDLNGIIEYMNVTAEQGVGFKLDDCRGKQLMEVLNIVDEKTHKSAPDPTRLSVEQGKSIIMPGYLQLIHPFHNQGLSVEVIASPIRDTSSDITGFVVVFHDVTESRSLSKMTYQATHDSLTGLINRHEFERRVRQSLDNARNHHEHNALCYLDLDNFKLVNDTCGHAAGDELLRQLTTKLLSVVRDSDSVARLGGDEFGILINGCSLEWANNLAERIRSLVDNFRFVWNNLAFRIGVSIGLVSINEDSGTISDILSVADSACYLAKDRGGNRIHKCEIDDKVLVERRGQMQWVDKIHTILEENRFRLFFQKIEKLSSTAQGNEKIHGEVLLRMLDESKQLTGPASFIPIAERYNLMPAIDRWVVNNTFRFLSTNIVNLHDKVAKCCINLSGQTLSDERTMRYIIDQIYDRRIPPQMLCFEISETAVIAKLHKVSSMIGKLREMGCCFALDDFGVGLSSFAYLSNLAADYLKIDGCFVKNMNNNNTDLEMVRAINKIGHTMNIMTIAEFVEDEQTVQTLRDIGVDFAQGYWIHKPVPLEVALLKETDEVSVDDNLLENVTYLKIPSRNA